VIPVIRNPGLQRRGLREGFDGRLDLTSIVELDSALIAFGGGCLERQGEKERG
jgi:hypothetical protein